MTENIKDDNPYHFTALQLAMARFHLGAALVDLTNTAAVLADAIDPDSEAATVAEELYRSLRELCLSEEEETAVAALAAKLDAQLPLSLSVG